MINQYSRNYAEVLEILKYIPLNEYKKIPKQKIEFFEENKERDYKYEYNPNEISIKTSSILINLYMDYIASDKQKEIINQILKLNWQNDDLKKRKMLQQ